VPVDYWPVLVLDNIDQPGAAGFHQDEQGRPLALVQADANWSLTASRETLEMLADPTRMTTVAGSPPPQAPDPISGFERVSIWKKYVILVSRRIAPISSTGSRSQISSLRIIMIQTVRPASDTASAARSKHRTRCWRQVM
jgi:hypothetical protein